MTTAFTELQEYNKQGRNVGAVDSKENFVAQMLQGLRNFKGCCHILLSGNLCRCSDDGRGLVAV